VFIPPFFPLERALWPSSSSLLMMMMIIIISLWCVGVRYGTFSLRYLV
jgi:hypothetical protein